MTSFSNETVRLRPYTVEGAEQPAPGTIRRSDRSLGVPVDG
ncbi:hypothetical protein [Streptomyces noursei]|nr:hypothetical protein [Streptomyces noursei]